MKRLTVSLCLLACALAPAAAQATALGGAITGRITDVGVSTLTVQTGGPRIGVINALTRAADALSAGNYPYVWGGGHALAGGGLTVRARWPPCYQVPDCGPPVLVSPVITASSSTWLGWG